eukprot:6209552-Pleurochrysis_carterae.AAC.2
MVVTVVCAAGALGQAAGRASRQAAAAPLRALRALCRGAHQCRLKRRRTSKSWRHWATVQDTNLVRRS